MAADAGSAEHRGVPLVRIAAPRANAHYTVPKAYADLKVADIIRRLSEDGWSPSEIERVTGIRYQRVRNTLVEDRRRTTTAVSDAEKRNSRTIDQDRVGSLVAFADLIKQVERGDELTITRGGQAVAQLIPIDAAERMAAVRKAMADMDEIRKRSPLAGLSIKELINEGRR